jgi:hypothetical protein
MNKRWIISAALLGVVGLVGWWIANNTYWSEAVVPTPLRGEALNNPFYAAQKMAEALGATAERRQSLGTLSAHDSIVVLTNWHWSVIERRRKQLEAWVHAGGRLILDQSLVGGESELKTWSGLELTYPKDEDDADDEKEAAGDAGSEPKDEDNFELNSKYPSSGRCGTLLASYSPKSSDLRDSYSVCHMAWGSYISSSRPVFWALHNSDGMQASRIEIGAGSVTLLNAKPFGNRDLTQVDHSLLFVAITQLKRSDHVVFLSEEEHPGLLTLIWLNGKPVVLLAALLIAVALWRGAVRFGPLIAPTEIARRSLAEQIRGTGLFILRYGGSQTLHAAVLRAIDEAARHRVVNYSRLSSGERVAALARIATLDADKLGTAFHYSGNRSTHELQQTIATLETVRRALLQSNSRAKQS